MAQTNDLSPPIDAGVEQETVGFDFGLVLGQGVTVSAPTVTCAVYSGTDATPAARLLSVPTIVPSKGTAAPAAQVNMLVGTMLDGVIYRLTCSVSTSDGQTLVLFTHLACAAPD